MSLEKWTYRFYGSSKEAWATSRLLHLDALTMFFTEKVDNPPAEESTYS